MILILAGIFLRERITVTFIVLSLVALAGMVMVVFDPTAGERR